MELFIKTTFVGMITKQSTTIDFPLVYGDEELGTNVSVEKIKIYWELSFTFGDGVSWVLTVTNADLYGSKDDDYGDRKDFIAEWKPSATKILAITKPTELRVRKVKCFMKEGQIEIEL